MLRVIGRLKRIPSKALYKNIERGGVISRIA
jgi:hypothetical protein